MTATNKDYNTFSHWDTTPVKVKHSSYQPDSYTALEWETRKKVERKNDTAWEHSAFEYDLDGLEI